jgi:hypothetical protein
MLHHFVFMIIVQREFSVLSKLCKLDMSQLALDFRQCPGLDPYVYFRSKTCILYTKENEMNLVYTPGLDPEFIPGYCQILSVLH